MKSWKNYHDEADEMYIMIMVMPTLTQKLSQLPFVIIVWPVTKETYSQCFMGHNKLVAATIIITVVKIWGRRTWTYQILTFSDSDIFRIWQKMDSDVFRFWHVQRGEYKNNSMAFVGSLSMHGCGRWSIQDCASFITRPAEITNSFWASKLFEWVSEWVRSGRSWL